MALPGLLAWRIVHPVTGVEVCKLAHPHASEYEVRGMTAGAAGQNMIGSFKIPLFAPSSGIAKFQWDQYLAITVGMRAEAYLSPTGDVYFGKPVFTGTIRQISLSAGAYELSGYDSLDLLARARTRRTEYFNGLTSDLLQKVGLKSEILTYLDDFSSQSLANYNNRGVWVAQGLFEDRQWISAAAGGSGDGMILTNSIFSQSQYQDCQIRGDFYWKDLAAPPPSPSLDYYEATLIAAHDGGATGLDNCVRGRAKARWVAASGQIAAHMEIDAEVGLKVGGSWTYTTGYSFKSIVAWELGSSVHLQVVLQGKLLTSTTYLWRVLINGLDSNCTVTQTVPSGGPTGRIGFQFNGASSGTVYATGLVMKSRTNAIQPGAITAGVRNISQYFPRTPSIDVCVIAAQTEGFQIRKNPGAASSVGGLFQNGDTLDFGANLGTDRSNSIIFDELKGNLLVDQSSVNPKAETLATEVQMQLTPGADHAGMIEYTSPNASKYGLIIEDVQAQNLSDFLGARVLAKTMGDVKSNPETAKKLVVVRDWETADQFTVLDTVGVRSPTLSIGSAPNVPSGIAKVLVQAMRFKEGAGTMEVTGDSYPWDDGTLQGTRLWSTLSGLASQTSSLSPGRVGTSTVYDSAAGSPFIGVFPLGERVAVTATAPLIAKFVFPSNMIMLQRVLLSFFLFSGATGVHVTIDGTDYTASITPPGPYTVDQVELDITDWVIGGGVHEIDLSSTANGNITGQVTVFAICKGT